MMSIHPPGSPPLDGSHFLFISGSWGWSGGGGGGVRAHTVEVYSNCSLISVLYATDFRSLLCCFLGSQE